MVWSRTEEAEFVGSGPGFVENGSVRRGLLRLVEVPLNGGDWTIRAYLDRAECFDIRTNLVCRLSSDANLGTEGSCKVFGATV